MINNAILGVIAGARIGPSSEYASTLFLAGFNGPDGAAGYTEESAYAAVCNSTLDLDTTVKKFGSASVDCTGNQNKIASWSQSSQQNMTGPSTIRFWYKRNGAGGAFRQPLVSKWLYTSANRSWFIALNEISITTADIALVVSTNGTNEVAIGANLTGNPHDDSNWHEVAATHDGAGFWRLFFDGVIVASGSIGVPYAGNGDMVFSGLEPVTSGSYFNGYFDECRITNYVEFTSNYTPQTVEFPRS